MVRVRNEENTLYESIQSLRQLTIPHEIVIILHLCTDRSPAIAEQLRLENPNVKVCRYDKPVSKAGYETLATAASSQYSLPTYYNWCMQQTQLPFVFKWDGDFVASSALLTYLNNTKWTVSNQGIKLQAVNSSYKNNEVYLFPRTTLFVKFLFWEVQKFPSGFKFLQLDSSVVILHQSELSSLKSYWLEKPWFETEDSEEARSVLERVNRLIKEYGPEPVGMARASNPECDLLNRRIWNSQQYKDEYSKW